VDALGQPTTFGFLHPVVLLPASLRNLPDDIQRAVMAHELWHVRRRDWAWVLAEEFVRSVLWFHPAVWWLISRIQSSREEVVDELTVLVTNSRRGYLEALLTFADQRRIYPATPFAQRRHLFTRMLSVSKEGVMSSRRIVASCAGMLGCSLVTAWYAAAAFPLAAVPLTAAAQVQQPPRDLRAGEPRPPTSRELELQHALASASPDPTTYMELARLQEQRGAAAAAEATLLSLRVTHPHNAPGYHALAGLYQRTGQFDRAVATLEDAAALDPSDPNGYQLLTTFYLEKVKNDITLAPVEKMAYAREGIAAADRALAINPKFVESMIYKNLLLRMQASAEPDAASQRALLAEADTLRSRAMALRNPTPSGTSSAQRAPGVPPPPPPPPPPAPAPVSGGAATMERPPIRVGGTVGQPAKIRDVRPVYPPEALAARIQGVVIMEAVIDEGGAVSSARVLRSIPLLDEAALDAVRQWQFTPTLLNGVPVPVAMTVTINFTVPQQQ
jgi:TonB family protein